MHAFDWYKNHRPWMTLNDLEQPKRTLVQKRCIFGAHCTNLNEIDPYYRRQKCRPMNLVSENIRFMRIFLWAHLGVGVKQHLGLSTTAIFGDLGGYVFENFTDTAINNM